MDKWDREAIELVGPAYIEFTPDGTGTFRFIAVQGYLDGKAFTRKGRPAIEFSWDGDDDGDRASGRGSAQVEPEGSLIGHIDIHLGDDSGFRALARTTVPSHGSAIVRYRRLGVARALRSHSSRLGLLPFFYRTG
jgi:hypothetical protein